MSDMILVDMVGILVDAHGWHIGGCTWLTLHGDYMGVAHGWHGRCTCWHVDILLMILYFDISFVS
jgi:hypothetical protein